MTCALLLFVKRMCSANGLLAKPFIFIFINQMPLPTLPHRSFQRYRDAPELVAERSGAVYRELLNFLVRAADEPIHHLAGQFER